MKSEMEASRTVIHGTWKIFMRPNWQDLDETLVTRGSLSLIDNLRWLHTVCDIQFSTTLEREFPRCKSCSTPSAHRKTWLMTISFAENSDQIMSGCAHQREMAYVQTGPKNLLFIKKNLQNVFNFI